MPSKPSVPPSDAETELASQIAALLADPAHAENPLREPLARLLEENEGQRQRLERLVRISDGYHLLSRSSRETLAQQYDRQLHRIEKLVRISDRYQQMEVLIMKNHLDPEQACDQVFGASHTEILRAVVTHWKLPDPIANFFRGQDFG